MNKEGQNFNPYQTHERRKRFIRALDEDGVLKRIGIKPKDQDVAMVYYLNDQMSGKNVGKLFPQSSGKPLGRESVRQKGVNFLTKAYNAASPKLQAEYTLEELLTRKPDRIGTTTARIISNLKQGFKIQDMRLPLSSITDSRPVLKKRGFDNQDLLISTFGNFKKRVEKAGNDDEELNKILYGYTDNQLRGYINYHRKDPEKILTVLSSILRTAGFSPGGKLTAITLEKLQTNDPSLPLRRIVQSNGKKYYVIYSQHQQRIIDVLKDDPNLQKLGKVK